MITSNRSFLDLTEEVSKASKYKELSSSNLACISSIYRDGVSFKVIQWFLKKQAKVRLKARKVRHTGVKTNFLSRNSHEFDV